MFPQIITAFKSCQIIEFITFRCQYSITHERRIDGQAYNTVKPIVEIELQRFHLFFLFFIPIFLVFLFGVFFLIVFFILFLFLFCFFFLGLFSFLCLFKQSKIFLIHAETVVSIYIEEHNVSIVLSAPTTMTAIACTVTEPHHCFTTQHPFCISIRISTLGQIVHFSFTIGIQKHNVFIIPTTDTYKFRKNPFTIGTPLKPLITITVRILILCIHHSTYLLSLEIDDADCRTIFKKCDFFSVRTILRIE